MIGEALAVSHIKTSQIVQRSNSSVHLPAVDELLCEAIQHRTASDPAYWSSPDRERREAAHGFFQYPAMMVPIVQRRLISLVREFQPNIATVYDPFMGSGTSLVAAMYQGLDCFGRDINPLAVLVARTKTSPMNGGVLRTALEQVIDQAHSDASDTIERSFPGIEKWFTPTVAVRLARLRRAIRAVPSLATRRFLWVGLAETVRLTSNDRTSTYKLHVRPIAEIEAGRPCPIHTFSRVAGRNLKDLRVYRAALRRAGSVRRGRYIGRVHTDLNDSSRSAPDQIFDMVVTSPPYGDNTTTVPYGQHSYLPLQWIDLSDIDPDADSSFIRTTQEIDRRSLGGRTGEVASPIVASVCQRSPSLKSVLDRLAEHPRDRSRRILNFYVDLDTCLHQVATSARSNAYMVWTLGNRRVGGVLVPTDQIVAELFDRYGVVHVTTIDRKIHHKRMATRNGISTTMQSEKIVILRKLPS